MAYKSSLTKCAISPIDFSCPCESTVQCHTSLASCFAINMLSHWCTQHLKANEHFPGGRLSQFFSFWSKHFEILRSLTFSCKSRLSFLLLFFFWWEIPGKKTTVKICKFMVPAQIQYHLDDNTIPYPKSGTTQKLPTLFLQEDIYSTGDVFDLLKISCTRCRTLGALPTTVSPDPKVNTGLKVPRPKVNTWSIANFES